ncbi:MAG TPA: hypothetical protein PLE40_02885 [Candidatus Pacearchaeota archaeon]|nr:hypothetical protein [Candidatus Pacearchaeota archaeon]HOL90546.1 hypothetical protein [Candidatus Pacearchaeota archaeon]HPO68661.1 hypothetical protein [Candidatus Pacearchaeota archaeon]
MGNKIEEILGLKKFLVKIRVVGLGETYEKWYIIDSRVEPELGSKLIRFKPSSFFVKIIEIKKYSFEEAQSLEAIPEKCNHCGKRITKEIYNEMNRLGIAYTHYCSKKCFSSFWNLDSI